MKLAAVDFPFDNITVPGSGGKVNPANTSIGAIITQLLPFVYGIAGLILLAMLIISGIQIMLAKNDPKAMEAAKARITGSIIGIILIIFAAIITQLVGKLLGINLSVFG